MKLSIQRRSQDIRPFQTRFPPREKENALERIKSISAVFSSISIPILVAIVAAYAALSSKSDELQQKYVEVAVNILKNEIAESGADQPVRKWAADLLQEFSPLELSDDVKSTLISRPLVTRIVCVEPSLPISLVPASFESLQRDLRYVLGPPNSRVNSLSPEQLERTALRIIGIQVLMGIAHRVCENFSTGVISKEEYIALTSEIDNKLITLALAAEIESKTQDSHDGTGAK